MSDQPRPRRSKASGPVSSNALSAFVVTLADQMKKGSAKYGTALHTFNGRDALVDAMAELVDAFQYVEQAREERREVERVAWLMYHALGCLPNTPANREATEAWEALGLEE